MSRTVKSKRKSKRERFNSGPGGMNCICCFPAPGSIHRAAIIKSARRNEAREYFKCEEME